MTAALRPSTLALFLGDIFFFIVSLWLSLFFRALEVPSAALFNEHLIAFVPLFFVWVVVYFIAGLYERRQILLARRDLSSSLLIAQIINVIIAALFFFLIPYYGISPKTVLFIYLVVSFLLVLLWRAALFPRLGLQRTENAILIGEGKETEEIVAAFANARRAPVRIAAIVRPSNKDVAGAVREALGRYCPAFIIADFGDPAVSAAFPELYNLILKGIRFIDMPELYEEAFGRVPLSYVDDRWLARNVAHSSHYLYDMLKRLIDVAAALVFGVISLVLYPFIALAIKLDDGREVLISMPRVGMGGQPFNFYKFRSMSGNDRANYGPGGATKLRVTRVGRYLRASRLDELPQLWNVLRGDLSLIGPRPEAPALVEIYEKEIPFYGVRHLIKPGLSGSAQLYYHGDPHHETDINATKMKLSYDLFYLKHRSLTLDLSIAIKTIRRLLMRTNA